MTRGKRAIAILTLLGVLMPGLGLAGGSQSSTSTTDTRKSLTISGTIGVAGVRLEGSPIGPGPLTDENGAYSFEVRPGWSGVIKPVKPGYSFTPVSRTYTQIQEGQTNQDYTARLLTFEIAGSVGLPGAVMKGLPEEVYTDTDGSYRASVPFGWAGRIMPAKAGFEFEPRERSYPQVQQDFENEDYIARVVTLTISGSTGVPGVLMQGLPGNPVSDAQGNYRAQVEYGWTGVVTPQRAGYAFTPPVREYTAVTASQNDKNYGAESQMPTISDVVTFNGEPVQGLTLIADPGGYSAVTDSQGRYTIKVPYRWSGQLIPRGAGDQPWRRVPPMSFIDVTSDIIDGKRTGPPMDQPPISSRAPSAFPQPGVPNSMSDVLVIPTADVVPEKVAETTEDMRVMLQILREKLSEPRMILGVLRDYGSFFDQDRKAQAFHLQGTAAVFVIQADFPRSFPTQQAGEGGAQQEAIDPVWQKARQKLHSPGGSRTYGQPSQTQEMTFEQFKDELLRSLRHAANIRHVDPNELVILTIVALNEDADWSGGASLLRQVYGDEYATMMIAQQSAPAMTVLTMQAKKADIDAFAKGALDFEQFCQKIKSFTY